MCEFIGVDLHPNMMQHHVHRAGLGDLATQSHLQNVQRPITSSRVGRWRTRLTADQAVKVNGLLQPLLSELGYR